MGTHATHVVMVGGFLGAGKTTLLGHAALALAHAGRRVGLVTNDQAMNLVDTALLHEKGFTVGEVGAGCFCCRFDELMDAADRLQEAIQPDVLLCEPVGSCTDLVATVVQPLRAHYADAYTVGPFSVLVDPARLIELFDHEHARQFPETVTYILRKQLEEADEVLLTKSDLYHESVLSRLREELEAQVPGVAVHAVSAITNAGIDAWIARAMVAGGGKRILDIDYDTYASGEAALGWLNGVVSLTAQHPVDWHGLCRDWLAGLRDELTKRDAKIAHIKLLLTSAGGSLSGNLTDSTSEPVIRGALNASVQSAQLHVNARVLIDPATLGTVIEEALAGWSARGIVAHVEHMDSLAPGRPTPQHRFSTPVG